MKQKKHILTLTAILLCMAHQTALSNPVHAIIGQQIKVHQRTRLEIIPILKMQCSDLHSLDRAYQAINAYADALKAQAKVWYEQQKTKISAGAPAQPVTQAHTPHVSATDHHDKKQHYADKLRKIFHAIDTGNEPGALALREQLLPLADENAALQEHILGEWLRILANRIVAMERIMMNPHADNSKKIAVAHDLDRFWRVFYTPNDLLLFRSLDAEKRNTLMYAVERFKNTLTHFKESIR